MKISRLCFLIVKYMYKLKDNFSYENLVSILGLHDLIYN